MTEWWTYSPSDFLLFSPRVYYRLFELHNEALWPVQLLTLALGAVILWALLRRPLHAGRLICAILGALWIWVAWSFLWERYATINWASAYVAPVFALQGLLLLWTAADRDRVALSLEPGLRTSAAAALFAGALILYPLIAPVMGRPWHAAEVFGIAPDPTAVGTLAILIVAPGGRRWLLAVIPALWCALSGETLWLLGSRDFFIAPAAAALAIALMIALRPSRHASP